MSFLSDFIKFRSISIENSPRKSIISKKEQKIEGPEDEHKYIVTEINDQQFIRDDNEIIFETALDVQVEQQNSENEPLSNQQAQQEDLLEESFKKSSESTEFDHGGPNKRRCTNNNSIDQQQHPDGVLDGNDFFGKSIAGSLRQFSRLNNIRAKTEICKVLEKFIMMEEES